MSQYRQFAAALLGLAALATGAAATFISADGAGSAALIAGGTALVLYALLGTRLESLKVGSVEFRLRETALELTRQAAVLDAHGEDVAADRLWTEARALLRAAATAGRSYEDLRRTGLAGERRVAELGRIIAEARDYASAHELPREAARQMFADGSDGERIYALALMQASPENGDLGSVLEAISESRSAFEQGHGLRVALAMLPRLSAAERDQVSAAVRQQLGPAGRLQRSTDRRQLAEDLLAAMSAGTDPRAR